MSKTERKLKIVSLTLIAVLVFTAVFNVAFAGGLHSAWGASGNAENSSLYSDNTFVKSDMNFDSVREQYFNYANIDLNTASYDGDRWVIVQLEGDTLYDKFSKSTRYNDFTAYSASTEGKKAQANLVAEQNNFLKKLDKHGIDYKFKHSYTAITNAVAIKVNAEAYNTIDKMNGVKGVYYSESYAVPQVAVTNNANVYTTGIYDSSEIDYKGEGMVVAILDTGLDHTHEAFQDEPDEPAWTKEYVAEKVAGGKLNAVGTADDFYYNSKVPFAYDYADDDPNVFPSYSSHGTHVAGIVAGKSDYEVNEETHEKFIGVAPQAQLMICKVFTDNLDSESLGGANTMDILAALNDCTQMGVDVINMSLGSSAGFSDEKSNAYVNGIYDAIKAAGISLIVAASNDYSSGFGGGNGTNLASNPDSGTVGSPSTYAAALSVASINGQKASYISLQEEVGENQYVVGDHVAFITKSSNEFGVELDFIEQLYEIASKTRGREVKPGEDVKFRYVPVTGVGSATSYTVAVQRLLNHDNAVAAGFDGTIAFVARGDITFAEKVQQAMTWGADACIIYNNVAGTIRMSLGEVENPIPTCSIPMDASVAFKDEAKKKDRGYGTVVINTNMVAGPFMSDFSSWGPTPNLELKPEITAHGGEITSAVPGGYDQYSGTSMAAPNMAGAVAILRQYLQSEYGLEGTALNARINQVLMSTATIANNDSGDPYSPRKQGAGLAGIADAINAEGYITVLDGNDHGEVRDRTKIELYDDPQKTGEYVLNFTIHNLKNTKQTYKPLVHVMTETMSSDNKTVAEKAYMLTDNCTIEYSVGQDMNSLSPFTGDTVTVDANSDLTVRVKITLNNAARQYLDKNFVNGMYVEGFVSMVATGDTKVTLGLPYLAFYGDWTAAPLFDYDIYEIAESDQDTSLREEEKLKASASETRLLGMYEDDKYYFPLGQYIYNQNEEDIQLYAEREKIAVSMYDQPGHRSIYELYMVYAGLLRGAAYMDIQITDAATGDVVFEQRKENISKSYAAGGSNRGAIVRLELKPDEWGLSNNSTYNVSLKGELDYNKTTDENGIEHGAIAGGNRNTFDFQFTVDYEEPQMMAYRIRYVPYTENKVTKYKIWMDVDVYDNQYVMAVLPCYLGTNNSGESVLRLVTEYPVPVYGQKGEVSTVSFEVTDIYDEYVKTGKLFIEVEDYAVNSVFYQLQPGSDYFGDSVKEYPDSVDFVTDANLTKTSETPIKDTSGPKGNLYNKYSLEVAPFTLYKLNTIINPSTALIQGLTWRGASDRVKAQANEIYAGQSGRAELTLVDEFGNIYAAISVRIAGAASGSAPTVQNIKFNAVLNGSGYITNLDSTSSVPELKLNPEQKDVQLTWSVTPWYCSNPEVKWESSNENIVKVDSYGRITAIRRGTAYVKLTVVGNDRISKEIKIIVGDEFRILSYTLYDYYGSGEVIIPDDRNIMYLDEDCFKGNTGITSVVLPTTLTEIPENAFKGCTELTEIVIPGQCTTIKESAFEGCTKLEKVIFGKFVDANHNQIGDKFEDKYFGTVTLGRNAFKNCIALTTIENAKRLTTLNQGAFTGCTSLTEIDLTEVRVVESNVFAGCTKLATVITSEATQIGEYMFAGCTALESFTFKGSSIAPFAFADCTKLASFTIVNPISNIGEGAFRNTAISNITLPNGKVEIAADAFAGCLELTTVTLSADTELVINNRTPFTGCNVFNAYAAENSNYYKVADGVLLSKDGKTLVSVPYAKTTISLDGITEIGEAAFAGLKNIEYIDASGVTSIGAYAFANSSVTSVKLPSGLTAIPNGLFDGCEELASVAADDNFVGVKSVGANAFRGCDALEELTLENATDIGAYAFTGSGLKALPSSKIKTVGVSAFENTSLTQIDLPALTSIGSRAFATISTLKTVSVGAIKEMGDSVFVGSGNITHVTFGEGTTIIGENAFFNATANSSDITVVLPNNVEFIGQSAFYNLTKLTEINLVGVKYVDAAAFRYTGLANADMSTLLEIGMAAFANTKLTSVHLDSAVYIGEGAFYSVPTLTEATFAKVEVIGSLAFAGTKLTTVTIPASMSSLYYEVDCSVRDEKGRMEDEKVRLVPAYGAGAFSNIEGLKEINVAQGNKVFKSIDGVLYSIRENGLVIEQYPTDKELVKYEIEKGTVAIADDAFAYVKLLTKVVVPYTVKTVGSEAFYQSSVTDYTFNSIDAPVLLASYVAEIFNGTAFGNSSISVTQYYANFLDHSVFADSDIFVTPDDFGLTITYPVNGRGYDSKIWKTFFSTRNVTVNVMPEDLTYKAIEAIEQLPTVEQIAALTSVDQLTQSGYSELAANARAAYNAITSSEQLAVIAAQYNTLTNVEKALRDKKTALGIEVKVVKLERAQRQDKQKYVEGEVFDPTGMIIVAIYNDGSEVVLGNSDYDYDKNPLVYGTTYVKVTYQGVSLNVQVQVSSNGTTPVEPEQPTNPNNPNNGGGLDKTTTIVIAVVVPVAVLLIAGVVVLLLVLKKKKAAKTANGVETVEATEEISDIAAEDVIEEMTAEQSDEVVEAAAEQDNEVVEEVVEDTTEE